MLKLDRWHGIILRFYLCALLTVLKFYEIYLKILWVIWISHYDISVNAVFRRMHWPCFSHYLIHVNSIHCACMCLNLNRIKHWCLFLNQFYYCLQLSIRYYCFQSLKLLCSIFQTKFCYGFVGMNIYSGNNWNLFWINAWTKVISTNKTKCLLLLVFLFWKHNFLIQNNF